MFLTPDEEKAALKAALQAKRQRIGYERQRTLEKIAQLDMSIRGPQTPFDLHQLIMQRGQELAQREQWENPFVIPAHTAHIYEALVFYFMGDERGAMNAGLSLRKGLLLHGGKGTGKSVIMRLFARNPFQGFEWKPTADIVNEYGKKDNAEATIEKYSEMVLNAHLANYYNQTHRGFCFDDLGAEKVASNFGKEEIMITILEARYNNCRGPKTHITTNLSLDELEKRYSERTMDRLYQMFNMVEFPEDMESMRI
ncbi:hypothetical protein [Fibrivirga algicola]|uniref:Uncharacterized protein n=1 Tax=Fibrivirga algicola TaxID=2950420 RepID=A0ABX0QBC2_9BACT|nr:hypothetical protein [Fibrivirga algicola]NID09346.1 hypothetical protein [Fibrivirga algicola]